jgi:hypothetical protein
MAEIQQYIFSYKEVAKALVKEQEIHEGIWGIYIRFGIGAANVGEESGTDIVPAAIVPVQQIGIQRFTEMNNLTVDAAEVNPLPARKKPKGNKQI